MRKNLVGNTKNNLTNNTKSNFGVTHWAVLLLLMALGYFENGSMNDGLNTFVGVFAERYGWSSGMLLSFSTYAGWISIIGIVLYGQLTKKKGARVTAIVALATAIAGMFLWSRSVTPAMYFLAVALCSCSASAIMIIRDTTTNNWFPTKKGLAMGWVTMGPLLATASILYIINWGGKAFGFHGYFDVIAVAFCVLLVFVIFWFRDHPEDKGCYPDNDRSVSKEQVMELHRQGLQYKKTSPWTVKKLLRTRQVWQIGIGIGGINFLIGAAVISQIIPTVMSYGYEKSQAMVMMTVLALCALPMSYLFGWLDTKFGTKTAVILFFIWTFAALLFMALPGKWTVFVSVFMIGGFIGGSGNMMGAMTNTVFGRYDFANAFAVIYPVCVVVKSCGYALTGIIKTATGSYRAVYIVLMVLTAVAVFNAVFLDDRLLGRNGLDLDGKGNE
ncbi:MAG: MFS transporter [Eubacterium sp.]|nr:MFS transporter [Eubacterium sp.]